MSFPYQANILEIITKENIVVKQFDKITLFELFLSHTIWGVFLEKGEFFRFEVNEQE